MLNFLLLLFTYLIIFQTQRLLPLEGAPSREGSFEIKVLLLKKKKKQTRVYKTSVLFCFP